MNACGRWTHHTVRLALNLSVICALWPGSVYADDRKCTKEEEEIADKWLFLNTNDRREAIERHLPFGVPVTVGVSSNELMLVSWEFVIQYDLALRVPRWVAYRLDGRGLGALPDRVNCFRQDPRIDAPDASLKSDYDEPIFDQGHLAPSEDMSHSLNRNVNSFIMSNMAPQHSNFNQIIWKRLESEVRTWAKSRKTIYVITGSIFDDDEDGSPDDLFDAKRMKSKLGKKRVAIPSHFFKILVHPCSDGSTESITFVLPHNKIRYTGEAGKQYLTEQVTSIETVEALSGVQFFDASTTVNRSEPQAYWSKQSACDG